MPTLLELYEHLKPKLGEREARELLEFIEQSVERRAATKEDLGRAVAELREEIQRVRADLLKWSSAFWVGSVAVLSGLMLALFNAYLGR